MTFISKKTTIILTAALFVAGIIILSGYIHYRDINRSEDPRVIEARKKMTEYNNLIKKNEIDLALIILDTVEDVYKKTLGYEDSYELGVVENNRGSVFLIKAEMALLKEKEPKAEYLEQAKKHIQNSIDIYTNWLEEIRPLNQNDIQKKISPFFKKTDPAFKGFDLDKIIKKRVEDIELSKVETERRLSVSYTNLGIIYRYENKDKEAAKQYEKAMDLWPRNNVAKNNLNQLLGRPLENPSIIQQMFFEERRNTN